MFKTDLFEKIGKFDTRLKARGGFDIFCRFAKEKALRSVRIDRVLVDADYTPLTIANPVRIFADIFSILHTHFGLRSAFKWFLGINHLIVIKMLWKNLKVNLFKKRS